MKVLTRLTSLIIFFFLTASCAVNPVTGKKQIMLMSSAQEVQLGAEYDPQVISTFGEYKNDRILQFLQAQADAMGKISHRPELKYHVKILDSPVVNAFAVPGGYIYFTRGILAQFNNEAELIGVLGHEMGHINARHSVSQQSKQQLGQLLLIGGMIASERFASYAEYAMQGMQLLFLKFSRDDEREADQLGVMYSSKIGYDANKMADFFQVLEKMSMASGHNGVPTFLSTHPDPGDRYNSVKLQAKAWQDSLKLPVWKVNEDNYLSMIDGIIYGDDPRHGYVEGNVFYHPDLKFKFSIPQGWQLENQPSQVNMAPSDGRALLVFSLAQGTSLNEAAQSTLKQLGLKAEESYNTTINGLPAIISIARQENQDTQSGQKQNLIVKSNFINYNDIIYVFHGITTEADFNTYNTVFDSSVMGFSKLTDPVKLNKKPDKIFIRNVQRTGTLADAFRYYGVVEEKMDELALLNNLNLTDRVNAGRKIKILGK